MTCPSRDRSRQPRASPVWLLSTTSGWTFALPTLPLRSRLGAAARARGELRLSVPALPRFPHRLHPPALPRLRPRITPAVDLQTTRIVRELPSAACPRRGDLHRRHRVRPGAAPAPCVHGPRLQRTLFLARRSPLGELCLATRDALADGNRLPAGSASRTGAGHSSPGRPVQGAISQFVGSAASQAWCNAKPQPQRTDRCPAARIQFPISSSPSKGFQNGSGFDDLNCLDCYFLSVVVVVVFVVDWESIAGAEETVDTDFLTMTFEATILSPSLT